VILPGVRSMTAEAAGGEPNELAEPNAMVDRMTPNWDTKIRDGMFPERRCENTNTDWPSSVTWDSMETTPGS